VPARRFFVEGIGAVGSAVEIRGSDAAKIVRVLRLRAGETIEIVDSSGTLFAATITLAGPVVNATLAAVVAVEPSNEPELRIDVAQALPKARKMEFVVEKATELGAAVILPFRSERTIPADAGDAKLERWRRLAKTAAQQCGRLTIPEVAPVVPSFDALLARFGEYDAILFAWELAPHEALRERLPQLLRDARRLLIVVGPEGGFTHAEADAANACGATPIWLGRRILRTETAAMALLAIVDAFGPELAPSAS
jgi:16S rRNA (uracil1498-N3)-methyltransferase